MRTRQKQRGILCWRLLSLTNRVPYFSYPTPLLYSQIIHIRFKTKLLLCHGLQRVTNACSYKPLTWARQSPLQSKTQQGWKTETPTHEQGRWANKRSADLMHVQTWHGLVLFWSDWIEKLGDFNAKVKEMKTKIFKIIPTARKNIYNFQKGFQKATPLCILNCKNFRMCVWWFEIL